MSRKDVAAIALRGLPREVRVSQGEEMVGTLLDSSAGSRVRLARELADLLHVGMRMRAERTARMSPQRLLADGFCRGAILLMTLDLSTLLSQRLDGVEDPLLSWTSICVIVNPRQRRLDLRRIAWLVMPAVLVAAYAPRGGSGPIIVLVSLAAIIFVLVAALKIPTDPRLAIACALPATYVGLMVAGAPAVPALLLCFGAPLVMGVAMIRLWCLPRASNP
jgi:hypothetical protein